MPHDFNVASGLRPAYIKASERHPAAARAVQDARGSSGAHVVEAVSASAANDRGPKLAPTTFAGKAWSGLKNLVAPSSPPDPDAVRAARLSSLDSASLAGQSREMVQVTTPPVTAAPAAAAALRAPLSVQEQQKSDERISRLLAFSQQAEQTAAAAPLSSELRHEGVKKIVSPAMKASASASAKAKGVASSSAAKADSNMSDDDAAAARFSKMEKRREQSDRISRKISDYEDSRDQRAIQALEAGGAIDNNEVLAQNQRVDQFKTRGQQYAKKAISFTETAMALAEKAISLDKPCLSVLAREYDEAALLADAGGADFISQMSNGVPSASSVTAASTQYKQLISKEEKLQDAKKTAEKAIAFQEEANRLVSGGSSEKASAGTSRYDRLAAYGFKKLENPRDIIASERETYEPMIPLAMQAVEARNFGDQELENCLDHQLQTHEALAQCRERLNQSDNKDVRGILEEAVMAHEGAWDSRQLFINERSAQMAALKRAESSNASDEEIERGLLVASQNAEHARSEKGNANIASALLPQIADRYDQVAQSIERAAACQEKLTAGLQGRVDKRLVRAQQLLAGARELQSGAMLNLRQGKSSEAEDALVKVVRELQLAEAAAEAAARGGNAQR